MIMRNGHTGNQLPAQDFYGMDVPAAPQRKRRLLPWFLGGSALFMIVACIGLVTVVSHSTGGTPPASSFTTMPAPAKGGGPVVKAKPAALGDGTYEVGQEIAAGTYTTTAPDDVLLCSWSRLRNFNNDVNSTIAIDTLTPGAHGRVTVKATDAGVKFAGGCKWARAKS
jgi:hypothetical protein